MTSTENTDRPTVVADQPANNASLSWSVATIISVLIGLAVAGVMTAAMFWIGDYYRGPKLSGEQLGRQKLDELRATEQQELENYGWINRTEGVVRIPIDRAMQLLAEAAQQKRGSPPSGGEQSTKKE